MECGTCSASVKCNYATTPSPSPPSPIPPPQIDHSSTFASSRVAVLMLGGAFRSGNKSAHGGASDDGACDPSPYSVAAQREASLSVVERVIKPLEAALAHVDVLLSLPHACVMAAEAIPLVPLLRSWYAPHVVAERAVASLGIGYAWQQAYRLLEHHAHATNVTYDYVLHSRHDLYIERSILTWPVANFDRILFLPSCIICDEDDSTQRCVMVPEAEAAQERAALDAALASRPECNNDTAQTVHAPPR
jgi:hypothetical protein